MIQKSMTNAMTVDVEDYFQVSAFEKVILRDKWSSMPLRVQANTEQLLELFDKHQVKGTFFVLGWVAQRLPSLIRDIQKLGHEVACHSYWHERVHTLSVDRFRQDTIRAKSVIEDSIGSAISGYRAPTFSITPTTPWAHPILEELGFIYSSSVYPIHHDTYGWPNAPRFDYTATPNGLTELPITTVQFLGRQWPCGGGGYFRLFPYPLSKKLIQRVNDVDQKPCIFYCHPWEIDAYQPRQQGLSFKSRFRHYLNISKNYGRLERLVQDFKWDTLQHVFIASKGRQHADYADPQSRVA